ncbi:MAG TPA: hypothetical protein VGH74_08785, partial [Planctomycetaceae bacterium]
MNHRRPGLVLSTFPTIALVFIAELSAADQLKPLVTGLKNPESVCLGPNGLAYVTEIGEFDKDGDGQVSVIKDGKASPFATGLDDPKGIVYFNNAFYVTDKTRVVKIDMGGKVTALATPDRFPTPPKFLNDIAVDPEADPFKNKYESLYVSDSGDLKGAEGAVYRIDLRSGKITLVVNAEKLPGLATPNGLALDGASNLLLLD